MKRALILGGTSDIGFAIANEFAQNKYDILLAGRNSGVLTRNANDIQVKFNVKAESLFFDVNDLSSHKAFWDNIKIKPNVTIYVFGYFGDQNKAEYDTKETLKIINTNYTSAVTLLNIIAEDYTSQKLGTIIGVSSAAGERGRQSNYIYGSAKSGFSTYLQGLRNHLYHEGVHVMTVIPGFVATRTTAHLYFPSLLTVQPEEVAKETYKACQKKKNVVYVKKRWRYLMVVMKLIPESIYKKMKL